MANGGARPGSGRKSKRDKYARPIAQAEKRIVDKLPGLIDKMFVLAEGTPLVQTSEELALIVEGLKRHIDDPAELKAIVDRINAMFSTLPDFRALQYLIDRIMGKPVAKQEVTGENGEPVKVKVDIPAQLEELLKHDAAELTRMYSEALASTGSPQR